MSRTSVSDAAVSRADVNWLYDVEVRHRRSAPLVHTVRHRSVSWYVDLDRLPNLPAGLRWLARFEARDHLGDPGRTIRANVEAVLAERGIDLAGGTISMLAQARSAGYVFNPLSLFWCHDRAGALVAVVAEVQNTYGERHAYVLRPDEAGRAEVAKGFRVSPFYPVDGYYRMSVPEPGRRLAITVTLHRPGEPPFVATVRGVRRAASPRALVGLALRRPLATWRVRAAITAHGLALYGKGLPVVANTSSSAARLERAFVELTGGPPPLRVRAWDGSEAGPSDGPVLVVRKRRALRRLLWSPGELGLARAYVTGDLDVDGDLADGFARVWAAARTRPEPARPNMIRSIGAVATLARSGAIGLPPAPPASEARVSGRTHSRRRDRSVIAHHYDLSNDFYALLLDRSMAYSSAYFTHAGQSLADAQQAKVELICDKLGLRPGARLLDVGCGWGSLILHAAAERGVQATGITLSSQQHDYVRKQIADRGLDGRVEVHRLDYRDLVGADRFGVFDAVSSIEMGEHVGDGHYPVYAQALFERLRPGGKLLVQQMSRHKDAAPGGGAFIEAYIAPDMTMRPVSQTLAFFEQAGFEIRHVQAMREHYVRTLDAWIDSFEARWDDVVALLGEQAARVWRLYLVGGRCAFAEGRMGVEQIVAHRPE